MSKKPLYKIGDVVEHTLSKIRGVVLEAHTSMELENVYIVKFVTRNDPVPVNESVLVLSIRPTHELPI